MFPVESLGIPFQLCGPHNNTVFLAMTQAEASHAPFWYKVHTRGLVIAGEGGAWLQVELGKSHHLTASTLSTTQFKRRTLAEILLECLCDR